ncbi:hypothetical protein 9081_00159 [Pseudomonas phage bmx-p3]|nr:hypothetical protein 9081_00159 [Pseudomonas phage bmx-p3]
MAPPSPIQRIIAQPALCGLCSICESGAFKCN